MDIEVSRPPKVDCLPRRIKGKHASSFKSFRISTNYYSVQVANTIQEIYIYKVVFTPAIQHDNSKLRMTLLEKSLSGIREFIHSPVLSGQNIYSLKPPSQTEREFSADGYKILVKQVKMLSLYDSPKTLLHFLNNGLRNLFNRLNYTEIGRTGKFFEVRNCEDIDRDLKMYSGFKANFMLL